MTAEPLLVVTAPGDSRSQVVGVLAQERYCIETCASAAEALVLLQSRRYALVLIESGDDGDEAVALLQRMKQDVTLTDVRSIVLLSTSSPGAVRLLESGADDVLSKPLDERELVARVRTCLSRPAARPASAPLRVGNLVLDTDRFRILAGDRVIDISLREFQLMHFLIVNRGVVHSRERLLDRAWSDQRDISPRTVDTHVRRLRVALQQLGCEHYLQTVRGVGYRFSSRVGANKLPAGTSAARRHPDGFDNAEHSAG